MPVGTLARPIKAAARSKPRLCFLACGSVDDGKSTLIGRLLFDIGALFEDNAETLARDSRRYGTTAGDLDFALLLDGLEAERQQGITIDVAYRYFASPRRNFVVVDAPGHEQYTRNMVTGASNASLAVILVDARKGMLAQTRRHTCVASLVGIRHIVLAVNKMDLVDFDRGVFERIKAEFAQFAAPQKFAQLDAVPIVATAGDNVARRSRRLGWYTGPTLLELLETIDTEASPRTAPFRMPVQWVNRPHLDFRGYSGTVASGTARPGDNVVVSRSGRAARIARIVAMEGDRAVAETGDAVTLVLDGEVDASRGDIIAAAAGRPEVADQFAAKLIWMGAEPMFPGRRYLLKCAAATVPAAITALKHKIDIASLHPAPAKTLTQNDIGLCNIALAEPLAFDAYAENRTTGSFILIDRYTNETVGAGMIEFALRRANNIAIQHVDIDKAARAALKGQKPTILWFTGLSGAGKSTVANLVERRLHTMGRHTLLLDGDNLRHGLNRDLGFQAQDRIENMRRVGEVAKLMADAGLIVLVSLISPFRAERRSARELVASEEFVEIHVAASLATCRRRDPKGLYKKADEGTLKNFTGVDSPYEAPEAPEITLDSDREAPEALADQVVAYLMRQGRV